MLKLPDIETLLLCSVISTIAFGLVFIAIWRARRTDDYLLYWAASSLLYGAVLIGFATTRGASAPVHGLLLGLLALTNVLLVCGVRRFDGLAPFRAWMLVPIATAILGQGVPLAAMRLGWFGFDLGTIRVGGAIGLSATVIIVGAMLIRSERRYTPDGRWIPGAALIAYVPSYALSAAGELGLFPNINLLSVLPMLSDQALLGILNLGLLALPARRAQAQLREAAQRDPLTGVWNRSGLDIQLRRLIAPGASVIAIDVDHFKAINDRFGHAGGDAVLVAIAREIGHCAHGMGGEVARVGGDEFIVILPATSAGAFAFADRVRAAQQAITGSEPDWTLSLGIASVTNEDIGFAPALGRADASLYRAKLHGRDRAAA